MDSPNHNAVKPMTETHQTKEQQHSRRWKVNKMYLPLKLFYFFFYGASGSVIPFIGVYLKHLHLSASEIGVIAGVAVLFAMSMRPLIGMAADRMSAWKSALFVCCLGFGLAFFCMWFLSRRPLFSQLSPHDYNMTSQQGGFSKVWKCFDANNAEICSYPASRNKTGCLIKSSFADTLYPGTFRTTEPVSLLEMNRGGNLTSVERNGTTTKMDLITNSLKSQKSGSPINSSNENINQPCFYLVSLDRGYHRDFKDNDFDRLNKRSMKRNTKCLPNCSEHFSNDLDLLSARLFLNSPGFNKTLSKHGNNTTLEANPGSITLDPVFIISFLLIALARSFYASSTSLADATTYTILGPRSLKWGQQRLWGTIGTAVAVMTITIANDNMKGDNFAALFFVCIVLSLLASLAGTKLNVKKIPKNNDFCSDLVRIVSQSTTRLFLGKLLFFGMLCGTANNFFLWYLVDLGSSQTTLGFVVLVHCLTSVVVLRYTGLILKRFGHVKTMYVVVLAYCLRYLAFSLLTSPWLALPVELLHGLTYSMLWAAASSTASIVAPVGTQATCQGIAGAVYWDFGRGLGALVSGQILEVLTAPWTFRLFSALCVLALPVFVLLDKRWPMLPPEEVQVVQVGLAEIKDGSYVKTNLLKSESPVNNSNNFHASVKEISTSIQSAGLNGRVYSSLGANNCDQSESFQEIVKNIRSDDYSLVNEEVNNTSEPLAGLCDTGEDEKCVIQHKVGACFHGHCRDAKSESERCQNVQCSADVRDEAQCICCRGIINNSTYDCESNNRSEVETQTAPRCSHGKCSGIKYNQGLNCAVTLQCIPSLPSVEILSEVAKSVYSTISTPVSEISSLTHIQAMQEADNCCNDRLHSNCKFISDNNSTPTAKDCCVMNMFTQGTDSLSLKVDHFTEPNFFSSDALECEDLQDDITHFRAKSLSLIPNLSTSSLDTDQEMAYSNLHKKISE
ncbi:major facilitator superfamily domain-containing protein 6-like protein A [Biomphalaria glabrata]|uniref:Major facilitator superfamily domain-containing protein 6-like protein A n=1 Tax=Biomphalaria glabrata TaxID=6526 RepID=A0A9U8E1C9_BIOGL|nr:major facilitator superfamily domain-containing protein 6-like protein A [Biomphalaria glabrata]